MPMYKRSMMVFAALAACILGGLFYEYQQPVVLAPAVSEPAKEVSMMVYVSGAVNRPGVVQMNSDARAIDAVKACGGLLPSADADKVNMAQVLKDGAQIIVPEKTAVPAGTLLQAEGRISINTADEKALDSLPGIGPAMARRILDYRQTNGSFQSIEELKKVKGKGELVDYTYRDGKDYLPTDEEVKKLRPQ